MARALPIAAFLLACAPPFWGCGGTGPSTPADGGPDIRFCQTRLDCPGELGCVDGICGACARDRECAVSEWCHPLEHLCKMCPGCGSECRVNDDCALGAFCVQGNCKQAAEVTPCTGSAECAEGERCDPLNLVCVEDLGCNRDEDCAAGEICDPGSQRCLRACTVATQEAVCGVGRVCDERGRCVECFRDDQCGVGLHCDPEILRCAGQNSCVTNRDCLIGQVCNPQTRQCTVPPPLCLSNADCAQGQVCDPTQGQCVSSSCRPDAREPNDTPTQAGAIAEGRVDNLVLCPGDVDWFSIPLLRGDRLLVIVNTDFLAADHFRAALFGPDATELLQQDTLLLDATVAADATYLLRFQTLDPQVSYGLVITVSRGIPCDDDGFEPNDSALQAVALGPGAYSPLAVCPRDADWFVVEKPAGQRLEVRIDYPALSGDLDLDLLAGDGQTLVMRSATGADAELVFVADDSGTRFFIRVYGAPQIANRYALRVTLTDR